MHPSVDFKIGEEVVRIITGTPGKVTDATDPDFIYVDGKQGSRYDFCRPSDIDLVDIEPGDQVIWVGHPTISPEEGPYTCSERCTWGIMLAEIKSKYMWHRGRFRKVEKRAKSHRDFVDYKIGEEVVRIITGKRHTVKTAPENGFISVDNDSFLFDYEVCRPSDIDLIKIRPGDKVLCVCDARADPELIAGHVYTCTGRTDNIISLSGLSLARYIGRFRKIVEEIEPQGEIATESPDHGDDPFFGKNPIGGIVTDRIESVSHDDGPSRDRFTPVPLLLAGTAFLLYLIIKLLS